LLTGWGVCYVESMNVMRFNIIDPVGTVSFVAPCHAMKVFTAACSQNPRSLQELLDYSESYDPDLKRYVLHGLAVFDEHNTKENPEAIRNVLSSTAPEGTPPFRIIDNITREVSLMPVKAGLVIFNLIAKRIIQVQNSYADIERKDRGRVRRNGKPTRMLFRYELPPDWQLVP